MRASVVKIQEMAKGSRESASSQPALISAFDAERSPPTSWRGASRRECSFDGRSKKFHGFNFVDGQSCSKPGDE